MSTPPGETAELDLSFAAEVQRGLSHAGQKWLSPKYLYDALGSALFEAITQLPEYGLWRAERRIFERDGARMAALCNAPMVLELGSGSATKTALLLRALLHRQAIDYIAVDISSTALATTRHALAGIDGLHVRTIESDYLDGLERALKQRASRPPALVLLLGSSLGNFTRDDSVRFLEQVRAAMRPGDALLLGNDLHKSQSQLLLAYDDPLGVTAAFNLNLLARMNRDLDADFDLAAFRHRVRYRSDTHDIEMHIESRVDQDVHFPHFTASFRRGETIHTESCHKYTPEEIDRLAARCGFRTEARWLDSQWAFASSLLTAM